MATTAAGVAHYAPYCGAPPDPSTLLWRWNLDPWLLAALFAIAAGYALAVRPMSHGSSGRVHWRQACFYAGWGIGAAAVVSPVCALSVSLFSARIAQHMLLETVAAPLIALGLPFARSGRPPRAFAATGAFAAMLWFWHAPGPYTATFQGPWIYWIMHATTFGAAIWLWRAVLLGAGERVGVLLATMLATTLEMGFLGALFVFAPRPLFAVHAFTTAPWGLTPLQDQQLGGVIMWVPAGAIFLAAIVAGAAMAMDGAEIRARTRSMAAAPT